MTGRKIGKWTVMYRGPNNGNNNQYITWHCKCECNREQDLRGISLRRGSSQSCKSCSSVTDLTNKQFQHLVVDSRRIEPTNARAIVWNCHCINCGSKYQYCSHTLVGKTFGNCKKCKHILENKHVLNLTGMQFDTVIADEPTDRREHNHIVWKCHCVLCNNIYYFSVKQLQTLIFRKCRCQPKEKKESLPPTVEIPNEYAKELIMMHHNGGSNNKEISDLLGFHVTTIKSVIRNYNHQN